MAPESLNQIVYMTGITHKKASIMKLRDFRYHYLYKESSLAIISVNIHVFIDSTLLHKKYKIYKVGMTFYASHFSSHITVG